MLARVPDELHARVKQEADQRNMSMTKVITNALELYLRSVVIVGELDRDGFTVILRIHEAQFRKIREMDDRLQDSEGSAETGGEGVS